MEKKLIKFISVNKILDSLKLDKLSGSDKYEILKIGRKIKLIVKEFEEFKQDIIEKYTSTDEFKSKFEIKDTDKEAEKYVKDINNEVNNLLLIEATSNKEVDITPISEELFVKLMDVNDLSINNSLLLEEILLNKEE